MAEDKRTLLEKLAMARCDLQDHDLKKGGKSLAKDKTVRFKYLELADFLPICNRLAVAYRFIPIVSYTADVATMTIYDFDTEDTIVITSPMANADVYQADEVQNLGAVQSYLRRYLYITAFDIAVPDEVDGKSGCRQSDDPQKKAAPPAAKKQDSRKLSQEELTKIQQYALQQTNSSTAAARMAIQYALDNLKIKDFHDLPTGSTNKVVALIDEFTKTTLPEDLE